MRISRSRDDHDPAASLSFYVQMFFFMTTTQTDIFSKLITSDSNADQMLEEAVKHFRDSRQPMEMFEAMKMRIRNELNLPLIAGEDDSTSDEATEHELESRLLGACREAGTMLIEEGKIGDGWMYLRPVADHEFAKGLLEKIEINDENYDEMIQVLLHEGVDVGRGYQAVLEHQGTCNSITLYEQAIVARSKRDRQAAAGKLLNHFYAELSHLVRDDIANRDKDNPEAKNDDGSDQSLGEMVLARKWLLAEGGYHLDTTHLSSVVRVASILDDPAAWKKTHELTQYGRRLDHQFQYAGEEPFVDFYPTYSAFYDVLLGNQVEAGLKSFERKARSVNPEEQGTAAIETYVDLLNRTGKPQAAIGAAIELAPADIPAQRIVPMLIEIATASSGAIDYAPILQYCQNQNDVLGFAAVLHAQGSERAGSA